MRYFSLNFRIPESWDELGDKQLLFVYQLLSDKNNTQTEIRDRCLLHWSDASVHSKDEKSGSYLVRKGEILTEVTPRTLAAFRPHLDWLNELPKTPVRISRINRQQAMPADFSDIPMETLLRCNELYEEYMETMNEEYIDALGSELYGKQIKFKPHERLNVLYWFASLKLYLTGDYPVYIGLAQSGGINFLEDEGESSGNPMLDLIRMLTGGDEAEIARILALDTHSALAELNAMATDQFAPDDE